MSSITDNPAIKDIINSAMDHYPRGNTVNFITVTTTGGDPDMAQPGANTPTPRALQHEPFISSIPTAIVQRDEATFRFSDRMLMVSKDDLTDDEAKNTGNLWEINDEIYKILKMRPSPSTWDFFIRKQE